MRETSGIYLITNQINGNRYIGSSVKVIKRWKNHQYLLKLNQHKNTHLQNAWNLYGAEVFDFSVLTECIAERRVLLELEQYYIDLHQPEYNICPTAGSRLGSKASEETKARMSASMVGKNIGKVRSPKTRALLKEIATNISDDTRTKMAAAKLGRQVPEETKARMSAAATGRAKDPKAIDKMQATKALKLFNERQQLNTETKVYRKGGARRKLSDEQIREIRSTHDTDTTCAKRYGVSQGTISSIRRFAAYKDVL
jgi:group I intron endonuclease